MKYKRVSFEVEAHPYEIGKDMEDGCESWSDVVIHGWIQTDRLVKITRPNGKIVCPYINTRRGRLFIEEGDYIITEADNSRHLCAEAVFLSRFHPI